VSLTRQHALGVALLFLTAVSWGFVASTVKRLTVEVDSFTISFYRVFLATIVFAVLFALRRGDWGRIRWLLPWILVGALGRAGNYLCYNTGLTWMPSNAVTILAPVQTISVILLAWWVIGERPYTRWLGLVLSLGGLIFIWWRGQGWEALAEPSYLWGNLLFVAAGIASAFQFMSQKVLAPKLSSLEILIPVFGLSTLIVLPFAWSAGGFSQTYSPTAWALLLGLGLVLTGGSFFSLAEGYRRCAATTAVVITNTTVFWTLIWSRYLLGESVSAIMVVGALMAVAGAIAVVQADTRAIAKRAQASTSTQGERE
jgi:drug/metabolite transporter (DMT)-like permease